MARQWTDPPPAVNNYAVFRARKVTAPSLIPLLAPGVTCRVLGHQWPSAAGSEESAASEAGTAVRLRRRCVRCDQPEG